MTTLARTNSEITGRLREQELRRRHQRAVLAPIVAVDEMLAELEELHLLGRKRVPDQWDERLATLTTILPRGADAGELRSRITITHLMDRLYEIQHALLRRKTGAAALDDDLSEAS